MDVVDDLNGMFQVIEGNQSLDEQKKNLRRSERRVFVIADAVKMFNRIIGDIAQGAAEERRDTRNRNRSVIPHKLFQRIKRHLGVELSALTIFDDLDLLASAFKNQPRLASQERVTRPTFAPLNTFEQKRIAIPFKAFKKRERRFQVHEQFLIDWNQVPLLPQLAKFCKCRSNHKSH